MSGAEHAQQLREWQDVRSEILRHGKYVRNPVIAVPIGVIYYPRVKSLHYLCVGTSNAHVILHRQAPTVKIAAELRAYFMRSYQNQRRASELYDSELNDRNQWSLLEVGVNFVSSRQGVYLRQGGVDSRLDGRSLKDPRLSAWLEKFLKDTKDYANVWLAPGVMDEAGRCQLNALMNIELPEDYEPVDIEEIELFANDGQTLPKYSAWFDITSRNTDEERTFTIVPGERPASLKDYGYSSRRHYETSRAKARASIQEKAEGTSRVVPSAELTDAPQPPTGVERWYRLTDAPPS